MWILFILAVVAFFGCFFLALKLGFEYEKPGLAVAAIVLSVIAPLFIITPAANYYYAEYVKDATAECVAAGGDGIIEQYRSNDICVRSDGTIIFDWQGK